MATVGGPRIVRSGLVLNLDAGFFNSIKFSNLIVNPSTSSSYSANQNVSITQDGQYVKVVSNQATSTPGAWPIGGIISVDTNTQYIFGIKGKVISNPIPYFYISGNNTGQILYRVTTLNSNNYDWSYITFNSTTNTTVRAGFLWSGPLIGSELSVETVMLSKFDTWYDLTNRKNNGSLINGCSYNVSNYGNIVFDGTNDYINMPVTDFNLSEFSIGLCFKTNNIATDYIRLIHKGDTTGATKGFIIANSNINGKLVFGYQPNYITGEILKRSTTVLSTSTIYNVYMTYINSTIKIYINGVEDIGETAASPDVAWAASTGNNFNIGSRAGGTASFFNGNMYNVLIYNRALSDSEVLQNYNTTKGRFGL